MKKISWIVSIFIIASMLLAACKTATEVPSPEAPKVEVPETIAPAAEVPATKAPTVEAPVAEAPVESKTEKVIRWGVKSDVVTFDPALMTTTPDWPLGHIIYSGLVRYKPGITAEVQPDLAESWDISDDGLVWTFHLRKGVQWHRGYGEVTAKDVVWTYERIKDKDLGSPYIADLSLIEKIEAIDDYTVRFTFSQPSPTFLSTVAAYRPGQIVCQKAFEDLGDAYNSNPVGSGPYMFDSRTLGVEIVLVKNPDHWDADNYAIDRIEWKIIKEVSVLTLALIAGDIDITLPDDPEGIKTLQATPGIKVDITTGTNILKLYINSDKEPFNDIRVRQAVNHAIDREGLAEALGALAEPEVSEIPPFMLGYTDDVIVYEYDPEKSKQLLAEAGYPNGLDFNLLALNSLLYPRVGEIVADMLSQAGFNVKFEVLENVIFYARLGEGIDYDGTSTGIGRTDPHQILYRFRSDAPGTNYAKVNDPELDKLLDAQFITLDPVERAKIIVEIQQRLRELANTAPLIVANSIAAYWDYVTGVEQGVQSIISWDLIDINK